MNDAVENDNSAESVSRRVCERIGELRQLAGWSLDVLSQASGVSRSMLSQIERGQANPTLAVTVKIASAFGQTVSELLDQTGETPNIRVIRAGDRTHMFREDDTCTIRTLSPLNLEKDVEFYELRLPQDGTLTSSPHFEGTREFLTVHKGRVQITSGTDVNDLSKGDSASYRADVAHEIRNTGRGEAIVFLVVIYR